MGKVTNLEIIVSHDHIKMTWESETDIYEVDIPITNRFICTKLKPTK